MLRDVNSCCTVVVAVRVSCITVLPRYILSLRRHLPVLISINNIIGGYSFLALVPSCLCHVCVDNSVIAYPTDYRTVVALEIRPPPPLFWGVFGSTAS